MKITVKQYSQTLFELTENKSQEDILVIVSKFAEQLKNDGQLKNAGKIMEKFSEIYNAKNGIVVTQVCGRGDVSQKVLDDVKEFVKKKYNAKEVEMIYKKDEKIQGGIIIKVGDEVIDGSVAMQLKKLKNKLIS
ncbi:MAG: ATP synthase subunit delta [Parcubacteria group bacterium GW2011_GWD2_38_11]|nr:MAG: ATP synthase subunit delta [Parcubacteria group bacterium GW2011_GWD2_38_11]